MDNFNEIFSAIKEEGDNEVSLEKIAAKTNVRRNKLEFYISCLQEIGLIETTGQWQSIRLTPLGKTRDKVFTN